MTRPATADDYFDAPTSALPLVGRAPQLEDELDQPSALTAGAEHFAAGVLPAGAGVAAFPIGAEGGAFVGAFGGPFAPVTVPVGTLVGGFGAAGLASWGVGKGQQSIADELTEGGYSATLARGARYHPYASFGGDLGAQLPFMRLGWNGVTPALAGGALSGGFEAGSDYAREGKVDPWKIGGATAFGLAMGRNTRLGDFVQQPATSLITRIATRGGSTIERLAADDVTDQGAAAFHVDEADVAAREAAIAETHPNLSPATRRSYATAEALAAAGGDRRTPDERAAATVIESDAHAEASNPYSGPGAAAEHGAKLTAATAALETDSPMPDLGRPIDAPVPALPRDAWHGAVKHVESRDNPDAVSPKGALGRMQVMPATAANPGHGIRPAADHSDAELSRVGDELLDALGAKYGDQVLATAAYNGGEGRVDKWLRSIGDPRTGEISHAEWVRRIPIAETKDYVRKVYAAAGHDMPEGAAVRPDVLAAEGDENPSSAPASAEAYVDRYLAGEGRGDSVADLELQQFAANNAAAIEAEFARRGDLSPSEGGVAAGAVDRGASAATPTGGREAAMAGGFDPLPHLAALRDYVKDRGNSLDASAIADKLGLEVDQARRVMSVLASARESGIQVAYRRQPVIGADGKPKMRGGKPETIRVATGYRRTMERRGPVDVLTFLADRGGLRNDEGHDLAKGRGLGRVMIPGAGALVRKSGMSIDAAGELLHEAGYFTGDRPTENEVLQLIERGARAKVYKPDEAADAAIAARGREMDESERRAREDIAAEAEPYGGLDDEQTELAVSFVARGETAEDAVLMAVEQLAGERVAAGAIEADNPEYDYDIPGFDDRPGTEPPKDWDPFADDDRGASAAAGEARGRPGGDAGDAGGRGEVRGSAAEGGGEPQSLERYSDPAGEGTAALADAIEHDLRMLVGRPASREPAAAEQGSWLDRVTAGQERYQRTIGDLWRLPLDDLDALLEKSVAAERADLRTALEKSGIEPSPRLLSAIENGDPERAGDMLITTIERHTGEDLSGELERLLQPKWQDQPEGGLPMSTDIKAIIQAHARAADFGDDDEHMLASEVGWAMRDLNRGEFEAVDQGKGSVKAQAAVVTMKAGFESLVARGKSSADMPRLVAGAMVKNGVNPATANELTGLIFDMLRDAAGPRRAAEPTRALPEASQSALPAPVDPNIAALDRQRAELGAAAPLRKPVEQDGTMGLALFDQADQPQFRLSDEGDPTTIKAVLDEIDADRAAVDALKGCMPGGGT